VSGLKHMICELNFSQSVISEAYRDNSANSKTKSISIMLKPNILKAGILKEYNNLQQNTNWINTKLEQKYIW